MADEEGYNLTPGKNQADFREAKSWEMRWKNILHFPRRSHEAAFSKTFSLPRNQFLVVQTMSASLTAGQPHSHPKSLVRTWQGMQKWSPGDYRKEINNFSTWCLSKGTTKTFPCQFWKYFLEHHRILGGKELQDDRSLILRSPARLQILFSSLSTTIFFRVVRSKYWTLSLYFTNPDLSQVSWLISWELCLIWERFARFSQSPATAWNLEHPHARPQPSSCAEQQTLQCALSELGKHLDGVVFLQAGKSK